MDLEVASHCVAPLTRDHLAKLPHHVLPCMNLQSSFLFGKTKCHTNDYFTNKIRWKSSIPLPLIQLARLAPEALNGIDSTTTLIRDKIKWQMKKEKLINAVKKDRKNISNKLLERAGAAEEGTGSKVPRGLALLAQHLDKDPDPHFTGVYNWYYTGGTLATLPNNGDIYLLSASQSDISCIEYENGHHKQLFTLVLKQKTPINQITASKVGAVARQKSCVSLFAISQSEDKICLKKVHSVTDEEDPFIGVALQDESNKKYCTLSSSGILKLWDVEYSKGYAMKMRVAPGDGVPVMDRWSSVQYLDSRTVLLADRCCIHLLDCRVNMKEKQLAWCPRRLGEHCEQLSYVMKSHLQEQVVYTMTTHQALTLDLRIGFGQRWSHMMSAPPYLGFTTHPQQNNEEFLCIASQVMSDCVVTVNSWKVNNPETKIQPIVLPSPYQGLMLARQQGLCLEPSLTQRFSQSVIGLACLPAANGVNIVRQTATGDLFIQQLINADFDESPSDLNEEQLAAFTNWSTSSVLQHECPPTVSVTDVKDLSCLLEALTDTYPPVEDVESGCGGGWRRSKQYMEDCVDLLAAKLLSVWEVEDEEEWQQEPDDDDVGEEQDPTEKVHHWLNEYTLPDTSSLKPKVTSTPFVRPTSSGPGQPLLQPSTSSDSDDPPCKRRRLLQTTPPSQQQTPVAKPPTKTAKKKFTAGF